MNNLKYHNRPLKTSLKFNIHRLQAMDIILIIFVGYALIRHWKFALRMFVFNALKIVEAMKLSGKQISEIEGTFYNMTDGLHMVWI